MNKYLFKDKYRLILYIILAPLSAACEVGLAYAMASALDYAMTGELGEFGKYVLLYLIYICLSVIADRLTKKIFFKVIGSAIVALKNDVNKHIISMRYCDFQKKSSAEYMTLLTTKVETLRNSYYMPLLHLYVQILEFTAAVIGIIILNPILGGFVIVLSIIQMIIPSLLAPTIKKYGREDATASTVYATSLKELLYSFATMKLFHIEKDLEKKQECLNELAEKAKYISKCMNRLSYELSYGVSNLMFLGIYLLGAALVLKVDMRVSEIVAAAQLMVYITSPLTSFSETFAEMKSAESISNEIKRIFDIPKEKEGVKRKKNFASHLTVKNLNFSYSGKQILQQVNYTFEKGKKYLIIGESGSGKSTLLHLIGDLYDDYSGEILLDDCDIKTIQRNDYAHLVIYLPQEPFLYDTTLAENVRLYEDVSDEEVMVAIEKSGLLQYVLESPYGLQTRIGEEASKLSGGEKQRLSLARALIRKGEILLLDECTSHLDMETSRHIEEMIFGLENVMVLYVAHNASDYAYEMADEVLSVCNGKVEKIK